MKLTKVNAIYTGGGVWLYCGKLADGNYTLTDDYGCTLVLDADPMEDLDSACYEEWQEEHKVEELDGDERRQFIDEMCDLLSTYAYGSEENGGITEEEIERNREYMKEDF